MSLFDRFRAKWKHPDPAVRIAAIPTLRDQAVLERLADHDPDESVRAAAIAAISDQNVLARIAAGSSSAALAAVRRLTDAKLLAKVAQVAASGAVREHAVDRIDDGVTLHRIATSDTNARVRLKARSRREGPDPVRDFIRRELAQLRPETGATAEDHPLRGTLDEIAGRLIGDTRFRLNGWLDHDLPGQATVRTLDDAGLKTSGTSQPNQARFLAFKRSESGETEEAAEATAFYEITIWRADEHTFLGSIEERSLKLVPDAAAWGRVSNSSRPDARNPSEG